MADSKSINTRLVLRNADLSAWEKSSVKLLKGEMAIARLSGDQEGQYKVRIGTGDKTWNQLSDQGQLIIPAANVEGLTAAIAALSTSYYECSDIEELTGTYVNGDIAVEKKTIALSSETTDGKEKIEYTAYRYNTQLSVWQALDGNYNANNVYFDYNITKAGTWTGVGNIAHSSNVVQTLNSKGKSVAEVMDMIFKGDEQKPTANPQPTKSVYLNNQTKEYGSTVSPTFTISLSPGSYAYGSNTQAGNGTTTGISALNYKVTYKKADSTTKELSGVWNSQFTNINAKSATLTGDSFVLITDFKVDPNEVTGYVAWNEAPSGTYIPKSNLQRVLSSESELDTYRMKSGSSTFTSKTGAITCIKPVYMYYTSNSSVVPTALTAANVTNVITLTNEIIEKVTVSNVAKLPNADTWYKIMSSTWPSIFVFGAKSYQNFYVVGPAGVHDAGWTGKKSNNVNAINTVDPTDLTLTYLDNTTGAYKVLAVTNAAPFNDYAAFMTYK